MTALEQWHTWREIVQQPRIWRDWAAQFDVSAIRDWIAQQTFDEVWFCGAGTSAYIGDIITAAAIGWDGPQLRSVATTDLVASPQAYLRKCRPLVVSFGRSGNSAETIGTLDALDALAPTAPRLNITCNADSALATRPSNGATKTIVLPSETHDVGFAMTSSFSTMLLTALAIFDTQTNHREMISALAQTFEAKFDDFVKQAHTQPKRVVYLGTGPLAYAAREAALKTLELTAGHIPSMWETTLGFRHGPKSFVTDKTMVVLFNTPTGHATRYERDLMAEMQDQFPNNIVWALDLANTPCAAISDNPAWLAVIVIALAQIQSVHWSHALGLNVDNPFEGKGTLSRVVAGVTLYEVTP